MSGRNNLQTQTYQHQYNYPQVVIGGLSEKFKFRIDRERERKMGGRNKVEDIHTIFFWYPTQFVIIV